MSDDSSQSNNSENSLFSVEFTPQLLLLSAFGLLALLLVCIFGVLLLDPLGRSGNDSADSSGSPALTDTGGQSPVSQYDESNSIVIFDGNSSLSIDVDPPNSLDLGGATIPAKAQFVSEAGEWNPSSVDGQVAEWVYGTVVNPVFGLSGSSENELLLQKLIPGDRISINYNSGEQREYFITGRELVPLEDNTLFAQNRPGVTLIWLGNANSGSRLVVYGDYTLPDATADEVASSRTAVTGDPVTFGNLVMTANDSRIDGSAGTAPPGFAVFLVDFLVENQGNNVIDSGLLRISLKDQQGNQYSSNSAANLNGTFPTLTGFINPGDTKQATAAFQIPAALTGDSVEWHVNRVDIPGEVVVGLPFGGSDTAVASVLLTAADVSPEGSTIVVSGSVTNGGSQSFQVNASDVSLEGSGTVYLVFSTTPGFPWNVPPGQTVNFALSFQRPQGSSATFTLLGDSFELNGIR